ncbi:hypothetical protein EGT71_13020 [Atlantibacter subterranea]|uniref:Uncharacterized protein n=1 Tax=Atlantibacter subterraneus TaxID=255519 RepID=A0A427UXM8_9ENTR|nr:hypothetical protein FR762_15345 [Enterobacter sp. E76]RSB65474.1 hypothetical protein EGK67_02425 [Atlantibacter subterranea]RSE25272.1 hypothetical protein EGT71_13020 [Atlantibacter subterranea]TSJ52093.1 hypothetical protein FND52_18900 [Atlantibacter subterranea]
MRYPLILPQAVCHLPRRHHCRSFTLDEKRRLLYWNFRTTISPNPSGRAIAMRRTVDSHKN